MINEIREPLVFEIGAPGKRAAELPALRRPRKEGPAPRVSRSARRSKASRRSRRPRSPAISPGSRRRTTASTWASIRSAPAR
ncbi:MAG: hypothetical protein M0C28_38475 [Candidatus Moduliflexus flocculans]|nr:hypothetical protein [Candidatus Moduliflexus flocculans]